MSCNVMWWDVLKILPKTENMNNFAGNGASYMYYTLK